MLKVIQRVSSESIRFAVLALWLLAARTLIGAESPAAPGPASPAVPPASPAATANSDDEPADDVISLAAYNVKADRIEDFGLRVEGRPYSNAARPNVVTFWFTKFAPQITEIVPNTAAAKAGLQPGERILKSEGQSTVGGPFSTGKFGQWYKTQRKKWAEVTAGKTNVTWTLEVESPGTRAVRIVKLVVPTPAPRWGSSIWHAPVGRPPGVVTESGPLAERSRGVLDHGTWKLIDRGTRQILGQDPASEATPTGFGWYVGDEREGSHRILVTQLRGRTDIFLETRSAASGRRVYLTSPSGALERAWRWTRKEKRGEVPIDEPEVRLGFEHELDLWVHKVDKVTPRWPFELKPGFDANAIFATLAPKDSASVASARPLAVDFLKLTPATEAQQMLFTEAYGRLGAEPDRWAYTETARTPEDKRVLVTRVDPSKPEATRVVLLSIDGKAPTGADVQRWRAEGGDVMLPKPLGELPPLANLIDLKDLRIHKEDIASVVFELPIRGGNSDFPAEKFQALFRVNKTHRAFEEISVKLRDSFSVAGVVKVTEAGLLARFQVLDPAYPPQPVLLKGGGAARILLVKIARDFETTRADFMRVQPYVEPDPAEPTLMPIVLPSGVR